MATKLKLALYILKFLPYQKTVYSSTQTTLASFDGVILYHSRGIGVLGLNLKKILWGFEKRWGLKIAILDIILAILAIWLISIEPLSMPHVKECCLNVCFFTFCLIKFAVLSG